MLEKTMAISFKNSYSSQNCKWLWLIFASYGTLFQWQMFHKTFLFEDYCLNHQTLHKDHRWLQQTFWLFQDLPTTQGDFTFELQYLLGYQDDFLLCIQLNMLTFHCKQLVDLLINFPKSPSSLAFIICTNNRLIQSKAVYNNFLYFP